MHGRQRANIIPQVNRAYATSRWLVDSAFGVTSEANRAERFRERVGLIENIAPVQFINSPSYPSETINLQRFWMWLDASYNESVCFLIDFDSNAAAAQRRA